MLKTLASRFADHAACIVNPEQNSVFQACLSSLANMEHAEEMLSGEHAATGEDFWNPGSEYLARYRPYNVINGVLQIPIRGVLLHQFPFATNWATGYEYIWQAYKRGMGDTDVKAIALLEHSPGGEVAGCFEAADRMYALKGTKPVRAFAHEYAYSAAYAIASVADHIVVSRTGGVGSIGVVTSHISFAKMLEAEGIEVTFIKYGEHKTDGNPYEALSPEARQRIQVRINDLGELFVSKMARNRGKSVEAIRNTQALTYSALEAVQVGLADSVGPLDDAMATYIADLEEAEEGNETMANATKEELDAARAEGHAAGRAEGHAAGLKEGATGEQARISGILASEEGKKRPKAAMSLAMKSRMSVEDASAVLADMEEEKPAASTEQTADTNASQEQTNGTNAQGDAFSTAMKNGKPNVGANNEGKGSEADADSADGILDFAASAGIPGLRKREAK